MRKAIIILICGIAVMMKGEYFDEMHRKSIESAIVQFSVSLTNNIESMEYDFSAILEEIRSIKSSVVSTNLLLKLVERLCVVQKDVWKCKNAERFQWKRVYLMEKAMSSSIMIDRRRVFIRWEKYLNLLKAMRDELKFYSNAESPDVYRRNMIDQITQKSLQRTRGTAATGKQEDSCCISRLESPGRKWGYKKDVEFQIKRYEKNYFDSLVLEDDYRKLNADEKKQLIEMVKEGLGRYPEWYREELSENGRAANDNP